MTTWSPDTCACVIDYTDDGNFTYIQSRNACPHHAAANHTVQHLAQVLVENRKKNNIVNSIVGATVAVGVQWSVSASTGTMTVKATAIPAATLSNLQAANPGVTIAVDATVLGNAINGGIVP